MYRALMSSKGMYADCLAIGSAWVHSITPSEGPGRVERRDNARCGTVLLREIRRVRVVRGAVL